MFRVKSSFKKEFEVAAPLLRVREFFADLKNLSDMLWGIESIHREIF
jgi:carbon monoxide dehydrogenase subunit G